MDNHDRRRFVLNLRINNEALHFPVAVLHFDKFLVARRFFEPSLGPILGVRLTGREGGDRHADDETIHGNSC